MCRAQALHLKAFDDPTGPHPYLDDLDDLQEEFQRHWNKIYGKSITRAWLLKDIFFFQQFLIAKLLEDYAYEP